MRRRLLWVLGMVTVVVTIVIMLWKTGFTVRQAASQSSLQETIHSAVASPSEFVKSRVTGGVGVALRTDNASGLPMVATILPGSPAESAGLRPGDIIIQVDGAPTAGQPLAKMVESIRGFTGGKVTITIKRTSPSASKEMTFVIHRSSWNNLGVTNSTPSPARLTNSSLFLQPAPNSTN